MSQLFPFLGPYPFPDAPWQPLAAIQQEDPQEFPLP